MRVLFFFLWMAICTHGLSQTPFTEGNIVVVRVGNPDTTLNNQAREVFLHEYSPQGALIQVIALPTDGATPFAISGTSTNEGFLSRSDNGAYLVMGGYKLPPFTASPSSTGTAADRVIARIGKNGNANLETVVPDTTMYPGASFRGVTTVDGTQYWTAGGTGGVRYATHADDTAIIVSATITNSRGVYIHNGQLYVTHASGTVNTRVMKVGEGLPTTTGTVATALAGIPASTALTPVNMLLADLSANIAGPDVMYVASDASGSGIVKYSLTGGGTWESNGVVTGTGYRGLAGTTENGIVVMYATRAGGSGSTGGGELILLRDSSGYNQPITATAVLLASAETRTAFRGVALAPKANALGTDTYIYNGSGAWEDAGSWLNGQIPPAELPTGFEIYINPATDQELVLKPSLVVKKGAKLTIAPGKHVKIEGQLVLE